MNNPLFRLFFALLVALSLPLAGCPSGDDDDSAVGDDDDATGDDDDSTAGDDDDSTAGDDDDSAGDDDDSAGDDDDSAGDAFAFRTDAATAYTRVDRAGMPAVATALIASKDSYNAGNPADDLTNFAGEVIATLVYLHGGTGNANEFPGLDTALGTLSLTPCAGSATDDVGKCVDQALSVNALPDTLTIDLAGTAGFPNGRKLADPVIDVTLAVLLLDLDVHAVTTFIDLNGNGTPLEAGDTLGPAANDTDFLTDFPYVAGAW